MNTDTDEVSDLDMTTDEALVSALTPKRVDEIELQPFSLMRQVIATDMCHGSRSAFFNSIITVWVCTLSPVDALKAHEDIPAAQVKAFDWAEARGYSITNYEALLEAYARLNRELTASTAARVRGNNGEKKTAGEPPQ